MNRNHPFQSKKLLKTLKQCWSSRPALTTALLTSAVICAPAYAQDVGAIKGKVTDNNGVTSLAGATVTATSPVMPKPRSTTTRADGGFSLPLLKPGIYEITVTTADGKTQRMSTQVLLDQTTTANIDLIAGANDGTEVIVVTGSSLYSVGNSALTNSLGEGDIAGLPVGQNYRDLFKLIPGVQYSENGTLGPSAGGSGVDNKYGFDGADVSLPLFGNLASEPSTHDIANVSMDRGGANAIGFNRSGGFAMNTTSKSGTNEFTGGIEYKLQNKNFVSDIRGDVPYELDQSWLSANVGGPIIEDELFFYASYYRPEASRKNKETAYGPAKDFKSVREEYFGKLTWAPTEDVLINASYRTSDRNGEGQSISFNETDSVSYGDDAYQDILNIEGSWLVSDFTSVTFLYSEFSLETRSAPDVILSNVTPMTGGSLDLNNLDQMGYLNVPNLNPNLPDDSVYNLGAQALINQYGYLDDNGDYVGGGGVGAYSTFNNQNFYRDSLELGLEHQIDAGDMVHNIHLGFKWSESEEELSRLSNGWGSVSYLGGLENVPGTDTPAYYRTITEQMSLQDAGQVVSPIYSYVESLNIEINDIIEHGDFTYNLGVMISKDVLYGQGLRRNDSNYSGWEVAAGEKYKMYTIDWDKMIQPRLGVTWEYESGNTVFANYASYNPEATSLARAASWDRNSRALLDVYFDENGDYLYSEARNGSSGKMFVEDMTPKTIREFTIGTTKAVTNNLNMRAHIRHRKGSHFWEDIPNTARLSGTYGNGAVPDDIAAQGLYIPDLNDIRAEIGGSSYVIAEMDGAFTKYWEMSLEAEYRDDNLYVNASYVWSHYYGNFDQDNTTAVNDANTFIGSSNYGDGNGRYPWDNKYGKLSGDKPHLLKVYGYYTTDWDANIGAYFLYQSGQPWERWSAEYYGYAFTSSATNRYGEPAGSNRSASHWQLDLNYTQDFVLSEDFTLKFRADLFNVFDRQTGYNINPYENSSEFGNARSWYSPRRLQLSFNVTF